MFDQEVARKLVEGRPWHHDFEIIPGVRTHGAYDPAGLWQDLQLPADLHGVSLADVGASNGYFSFAAHGRGARVVAFDYRHKDNSGFGLAQHINGLTDIEHHHVNVLDISPARYGQFDIVLALGLVYHVADPYRAVANCAGLARERLLIESFCIDAMLPETLAAEPLMRFISDPHRFPEQGQPNPDRSNFWGFTAVCLERLLEDLGFAVQRKRIHLDRVLVDAVRVVFNEAATRRDLAYGLASQTPVGENPNDPAAWRIF
jgi:tRNA (mo5U34)-methyltransferase